MLTTAKLNSESEEANGEDVARHPRVRIRRRLF